MHCFDKDAHSISTLSGFIRTLQNQLKLRRIGDALNGILFSLTVHLCSHR